MSHLKLYLDDVRIPYSGWVLAKDVPEARSIIASHMRIEDNTFEVSLDFDLGEDGDLVHEKGVMLILWFMEVDLFPTNVYLHTANPVGMKSMDWALKDMEKYQGELVV